MVSRVRGSVIPPMCSPILAPILAPMFSYPYQIPLSQPALFASPTRGTRTPIFAIYIPNPHTPVAIKHVVLSY